MVSLLRFLLDEVQAGFGKTVRGLVALLMLGALVAVLWKHGLC